MAVTITAHAIVRYFERIEGIRFSDIRQTMRAMNEPDSAIRGDTGVVRWMRTNGYHVAAVEALFDQPMVERAIAIGALRVRVDTNCWAVLNHTAVISCVTDDMVKYTKPLHEKSGKNSRKKYFKRPTNRRMGWNR